ncbi:MAG: PfkB family carbohydrate kinase [Phycisphaerae bacterium]
MSAATKIVSLEELRPRLDEARSQGKTVVQCHGCFDNVHSGHIRYLQFARQQGDVLVVSITGDSSDSDTERTPYVPQDVRAENLAQLVSVDWVCVTPEVGASDILQGVRPDVYVKGREFERSTDPVFLAEKRAVEDFGGRIIFSSGETVFSASQWHEPANDGTEDGNTRLRFYCGRHGISGPSLTDRIKKFKDQRVLVIGDIVIDDYVLCDALGVASESPVLSLCERDTRRFLGGAAIVARHIAALGGKPFLVSVASDDDDGRYAQDLLKLEGVETHLLPARPNMVRKTRYLVDDAKVLKVDHAEACPLDSLAERNASKVLESQSRVADAVVFCDFGFGMITGSLLSRVLPMLRQNVRVMTADVSGGRGNLAHFRHADLICPTEREVRAMLNDYDSGLSAVAWQLLARTDARHLFVTMEKRGLVLFQRPGKERGTPEWAGRLRSDQLPSFADRVVDRLGCGDALLSAATLALAAGATLEETAYLGNAAAAIEIALMGNHPIACPQLLDWMARRSELAQPERSGSLSRSVLQGAKQVTQSLPAAAEKPYGGESDIPGEQSIV